MFLDRDGTLIRDVGYLDDPDDIELISGVVEGLQTLLQHGRIPVVVTNQSGVARGYFSLERLREIHKSLHERFQQADAPIWNWFFCPHLPEDQLREHEDHLAVQTLIESCSCRKPEPGLWFESMDELPDFASFRNAWSIGDKISDVRPGVDVGGKSILLQEDPSKSSPEDPAVYAAQTFTDAVERMIH